MRFVFARHLVGLAALVPLLLCADARAQKSPTESPKKSAPAAGSLEILGIVSDDAEEQADALTAALRAQATTLPGLQIGGATQTLDVMTTANRCPQEPDPLCQIEIAKQLKTNQYLWGILKKEGASEVVVEIHHFVKDKQDHFITRRYAANLRDQNDDALRSEAKAMLVKLLEVKTGFVHAKGQGSMASCAITIDGNDSGALRDGALLVETTPGEHTVATVAPCPSFKQTVNVPVSGEASVDLLDPAAVKGTGAAKDPFFNTQRIVGAGLMGAGLVSSVVSVVFLTQWLDAKSTGQDKYDNGLRNNAYGPELASALSEDTGATCKSEGNPTTGFVGDVCKQHSRAKLSSGIAIATGVGGVALLAGGAVLFFTADKKGATSAKLPGNLRLQPSLGTTNGLWLSGSF